MRNFLFIMGLLIGSFIIAVIGIGLFLMLSPGAEVFGIKYIKATASNSTEVTKTYDKAVSGDLVFDTNGVPIEVEFHPYSNFEFTFVQKFNGFTRTDIDRPNISLEIDDETGNLKIATSEYVAFLWGVNSSFSLKCKIPATYRSHNVTFSSNKSKITFVGNDQVVSEIDTLTIQTSGVINFADNMKVKMLNINNKSQKITIPSTMNLNGANIISKGAKILTTVSGKLSYDGGKYSLEFISAGELSAKTTNGKVVSTAEGTSVFGNVDITTKKGVVTLQHVVGDLTIKTTSGKVEIGQNLKVATAGVGGKTNIETNTGDIYLIGEYLNSFVNIKTNKGKIYIGDNSRSDTEKENGPLSKILDLEISTSSGRVEIEQVSTVKITAKTANIEIGKVLKSCNITTTSGDVELQNVELGAATTITTGKNGNVTASNMNGPATISAGGFVSVVFKNVLGKIDITGTSNSIKVVVPDSISETNRYIWIDSEKTDADIKITGLNYTGKSYHSVQSIPAGGEAKLIKITSTSGKIALYSMANA